MPSPHHRHGTAVVRHLALPTARLCLLPAASCAATIPTDCAAAAVYTTPAARAALTAGIWSN